MAVRSHPNFVAVTRALNNLWSAAPGSLIDFDNSVTYCDRLRIRKPGDSSFKLGEHMDGGSVERMFLKFILYLKYPTVVMYNCTDEIIVTFNRHLRSTELSVG